MDKHEKETDRDIEDEDNAPKVQSEFVAAKGSVPVNPSKKRKAEDEEDFSKNTEKTKIM